jgi:hypothetical protein
MQIILPIIIFIIGYWTEILQSQSAHLPFWIIKETIGIFLCIGIDFLQLKQKDCGEIIDRLFGSLKIITFKKLPYIDPRINIIIGKIICIYY